MLFVLSDSKNESIYQEIIISKCGICGPEVSYHVHMNILTKDSQRLNMTWSHR